MERHRPPYWMLPAFALLLALPPGLAIPLALAAGALRTAVSAGRWASRYRRARAEVRTPAPGWRSGWRMTANRW